MPALGAPELIIILVIIVLIFGVGKLPEVGSALGKGLREFRSATDTDKDDTDKEEPKPSSPTAVEAPRTSGAIEAPRTQADVAPPPTASTQAAPAPPAPAAAVPSTAPAASSTAAPAPAPSAQAAPAQPDGTTTHVVQAGDTLDSVAQRHGVTVEALMQANGYSQRDRVLYAGDSIKVPRATGA